MKIFVSYSHADELLRIELEKHLAALRRQGFTTVWHDRKIRPGEDFAVAIDQAIDDADLILLLVSADFIASDYCHEIEMRRAIERHKSGKARVVPIILRACDWHHAPFGKLNALPKDGVAVTSHANQDEALSSIASALRNLVSGSAAPPAAAKQSVATGRDRDENSNDARAKNPGLKINRLASDQDRSKFRRDAFECTLALFKENADAAEKQNPGVSIEVVPIHARKFTAEAFVDGNTKSRCKIWSGTGGFSGDLAMSIGSFEVDNDNSLNESLHIEADKDGLYLRALGMRFGSAQAKARMLPQDAAVFLWDVFFDPLKHR